MLKHAGKTKQDKIVYDKEKLNEEYRRVVVQQDLFQTEKATLRLPLYSKIYESLALSDMQNISKLRRLEIRLLPLDPLLCECIFKAMGKNITL